MLGRSQAGRICSRCRLDLLSLFERGFCDPKPATRSRVPLAANRLRLRPKHRTFTSSATRFQHESRRSTHPPAQHNQPTSLEQATEQLAVLQKLKNVLGENTVDEDQLRSVTADVKRILDAVREEADGDDTETAGLTDLVAEAEALLDFGARVKDGDPAFHTDKPELPSAESADRREDERIDDGLYELGDRPVEIDEPRAAKLELSAEAIVALREEGASPVDVAREARQVFGEHLPEGVLQEDERKIYRRMYDEPLAEIDEEPGEDTELEIEDASRGELVDRRGERINTSAKRSAAVEKAAQEPAEILESTLEDRAMSIAEALDAEYTTGETYLPDEEPLHAPERAHPLTALGKAGTRPSTISLPKSQYAEPLQRILSDYSNKQLKDTAERTFGGPGLPDSPLTPRSGRSRKQVPVPLQASHTFMGEMEANVFITSIVPPAYAAIASVLTETRKRLGQTWLTELLAKEKGPRVLDAGAGGAGVIAWNEVIRAHWQSLHSSDASPPPPPPSRTVVLTGSDPLRHRSAALLDNTTFIPRLPDYIHTRDKPTIDDDRSTQQRKQFDVIISSYSLLPLKEDWEKKQYVQNLWTLLSPSGGILILIEKGMPRGFEAIAGARDLLLERYIATPTGHNTHYTVKHQDDESSLHKPMPSMIVAPCTNHEKCPMYRIPGESRGRKDFCSFQQRYIRPPQLQRILGARDRNHDDVDFSYISVMKGRDLRKHQFSNWNDLSDPLSSPQSSAGTQAQSGSNAESWMQTCKIGFASTTPESILDAPSLGNGLPPTHLLPRMVFPPLKRQGHILLDVCTPSGTLERWTVPRSFSKQAFRDSRKAQWGDLWALGAKTRVPRKVRVGADSTENRTTSSRDERQKRKALEILGRREEEMEAERIGEEEMGREVDDWKEALEKDDEEDDDDDDEFSDDIVNQVWQDIGAGQVEQHGRHPKAPLDGNRTPRQSSVPQNPPQRSLGNFEDAATRQLWEEWEAEFDPKVFAKHKRQPVGRATKESTREMKRKYRELRRHGGLETGHGVS